MSLTAREILIYLSLKNNGKWEDIYENISQRKEISNEEALETLKSFQEENKDIKVITILDEEYPEILKQGYRPPFVLFCKGDTTLLKENIIAFLGSREKTNPYIAQATINKLKEENSVLITTTSRGENAETLSTAIENGIKTILVLSSGISKYFPLETKEISKKVNLIISEYPPQVSVDKKFFVRSKQILVSLCKSLCVGHINPNSGILLGIHFALEGGKDIFVAPVDLSESSKYKNNEIIEEGAYILR